MSSNTEKKLFKYVEFEFKCPKCGRRFKMWMLKKPKWLPLCAKCQFELLKKVKEGDER